LVSKWIALSSLRVKKYLHEIHVLVQPEIHAAAQAIAAVLDEIAHELPTHIAVGADTTPPASRSRARSALEPLNARIIHVRPAYIGKVSSAEIENFASFTDSLAALTGHIERLLDEPPPATGPSKKAVPPLLNAPDPSISCYSLKVGACAVAGYIVGVTYPARRFVHYCDEGPGNRASNLRHCVAQDDSVDHRSSNRGRNCPSDYHHARFIT
jgi:hypothetical protein